MPLYANVYRKRVTPPAPRRWRFQPIAREALRGLLARRLTLPLLFACWLPFFGAILYLAGARLLFQGMLPATPFDGPLLARWLSLQTLIAAFLTTFAGAHAIAGDLHAGGIVLYLSRSLTRRDYVLGKLVTPLAGNLAVTFAPTFLLLTAGAALDPDRAANWRSLGLACGAFTHTILVSIFLGLVALAFSALTRNAALAGFAFFLAVIPLNPLLVLAGDQLGSSVLTLFSIRAGLDAVGGALLGTSPSGDPGWAAHAAALAAMIAGALGILRARVRPEESIS
ncbi:MAG: ABC transporter permease [Vicinamibacteria bacterium]|nr:ABC transporter permease [Vicinamibacteria bacterium]